MPPTDRETNRFSARADDMPTFGNRVGGVAARLAGQRLLGPRLDRAGKAQRRLPRRWAA